MLNNISIWVIAYIMGSISFGVLFARAHGINLRKHGSRNIGATNVVRTLGKKAGILTLLGDTLKGWLAVALASWVLRDPIAIAGAGFMVFLGHLYSVFLKFKGGKGVATALGINLYLMPKATLSSMAVFTFILWVSKYVSLSSILAAIILPIFGVFLEAPPPYIYVSLGIAMLVVIKHQDNIRRIISEEEPRFPKK